MAGQQKKFIIENSLNEIFGPPTSPIGIVIQGGMYNGVIRALQRLGLGKHQWRKLNSTLYI
jgi:indolepyruvate ferredoxin oxidoreductase alpha subunit